MKLISIQREKYEEYRLKLLFDCYKWDPQFLDNNTVAKYALVITENEHNELMKLTEELDCETRVAEEFLNKNLRFTKQLKLTGKLKSEIKKMNNYDSKANIRLTRYDFHPTVEGKWAVSEVNSDVPGGFAEASLMPRIALEYISKDNLYYISFGERLVKAISEKVPKNGRIMLVHCTCYSDDRQVMQFLGDKLSDKGYNVIYGAADHIRFKDNVAYSILDGNEGRIDGIIRFTPLEWLTEIKPKRWQGYFDTTTVSCNHPIAIYAQTKRFPLVWDVLEQNGIAMCTWKELLPDTIEVKHSKGKDGYIFKPAYGRVGEKISIEEACRDDEYKKIIKDVRKHPKKYLAQKMFDSRPLQGENGEKFHVCLGSYAVDGKHAGYYARISETRRIDSNAADIPVLIEKNKVTKLEGEDLFSRDDFDKSKEKTMRDKAKEAFSIWAPDGEKWVDWVRPVPFIGVCEHSKMYKVSSNIAPRVEFLKGKDINKEYKNAGFIVDLPGSESVMEGLALAKLGFRPIPIFNGTMEQSNSRATVDNQAVGMALIDVAKSLGEIQIPKNAIPVFLTDKNRLHRYKMKVSVFDNSWDVYHQDLPTAEYFLKNGINRIIIIGDSFSKDLKKILYGFKKKNIEIFLTDGYAEPKKVNINKIEFLFEDKY